uniref:Complement component c3a, duplicate 5 n=1 Tax=Oreochromis niloticus TaxID=8128 RepID=A0A669C3N5_ORENI
FEVQKVMSAPNVFRVGAAENIFVECQDCTGGDIRVDINVMNHPTKIKLLAKTIVTLSRVNNFQQFGKIKIPAGDFNKDPSVKQYVYLQAQFPDCLLEKVVMVSFQSGYIFIQTDKTLYTPNSRVLFRVFALTPQMEPLERDEEIQTDTSIIIQFVTPEGIILLLRQVFLRSGLYSGSFHLDETVSTGLWKVVAKFHSNPQQKYSAEFEVKEYVLPSFEVKLTPLTQFFYVNSRDFTVRIKATYLFGQEVDGTAYVVFGVRKGQRKQSFPDSLQKVPIRSGEGEVTLRREDITKVENDINSLVGGAIFVSWSEMVEAELRGIQIVTSPYTINFKRTPKYFKPGMSFDVRVEVLNPDETPAANIPVVINPGAVRGLTAANGMAWLTINTGGNEAELRITAMTDNPMVSPDRQARAEMTAGPYSSKTGTFIHIGVDAPEKELGDNLRIYLFLNKQPNQNHDITYLIQSRGQLVKYGRYETRGQVPISLIQPITKEMLPSFRIIAYYHTSSNEVVSDSVWVDVKDTCMGTLKLEFTQPSPAYEPRRTFRLKVTASPEATVGLIVVDKGVYALNNKHRLTQKKLWEIVEESDTGCTPGGGKDSMGVFFDAGLLFETSAGSGTAYRQELKCHTVNRKKRNAAIMDVRSSLCKYPNPVESECCLDGMKEAPLSYTCEACSDDIVNSQGCRDAFLHCCKTSNLLTVRDGNEMVVFFQNPGEEEDTSFIDSNEIVTRTMFPESWLWHDIKFPACPRNTPNCDTTSFVKYFYFSDSITTWQFIGISLSRTNGICVGDPFEVIVKKDFFIDLRLPYSAVRGEQIEIKAILHNYSPDRITVRVDLTEEEHVCSSASKRGRYHQEVTVGPETTRSVPFVIIPMKEGERRIEVKAAVKGSYLNDGVMKMLRVVPEGVLVKHPQIITLDPAKKGEIISSGIPRNILVPNTATSTQIFVTGREQVSKLVENAIGGNSMGTLIIQPSGSGELNIMSMTLPVIATLYLDKTNQWETVGFEKRKEALQYIKTGYTNELAYRKNDGSFAAFTSRPSSTWLTAYVAKVFVMTHHLVEIQNHVICEAVKFLILTRQQPDGVFKEFAPVIHQEMTGDVAGLDSDASMTAFCLIAMQESRSVCSGTVTMLPGGIDKAVAYLENRLPSLTNPYAVAMTSYALANENKPNKKILYKFVSPELSHWPVHKGSVYTLEATAYALLALVKTQKFEDARPVVRWFSQQQKVGGGYGSTQATIMVYQAVAEYWNNTKEPQYDLNVDIQFSGMPSPNKYYLNRDNHYATRTFKVRTHYFTKAKSPCIMMITLVSRYYAKPKEQKSDCQDFTLSVELIPGNLMSFIALAGLRIPEHDCIHRSKHVLNSFIFLTCPDCVLPENCSMQKENITNDQRQAKICESTETHKVDFAYKVHVAELIEEVSTDSHKVQVLDTIKEGNLNANPVNKHRIFLSYQHCREALGLEKDKTYLIMVYCLHMNGGCLNMFKYMIDERTWVEYWPTAEECQTDKYWARCLGLELMVNQYSVFGCIEE